MNHFPTYTSHILTIIISYVYRSAPSCEFQNLLGCICTIRSPDMIKSWLIYSTKATQFISNCILLTLSLFCHKIIRTCIEGNNL